MLILAPPLDKSGMTTTTFCGFVLKEKYLSIYLIFFLTQMIDWWMHSFEIGYPFGAM